MRDNEVAAGDVVAFNTLPDAVWFDVMRRDGFTIHVRQHGLTPTGKQWSEQTSDVSLVKQWKRP